jgi:hypothetical protein
VDLVEDEPEFVKRMVQYFYELDYHLDTDLKDKDDYQVLVYRAHTIEELSSIPKKLADIFPSHTQSMEDAVVRYKRRLKKVR